MNQNKYRVAQHLFLVQSPDDHLDIPTYIPSFAPFVSAEEGDVLFTLCANIAEPHTFKGWDEIGQFDCGGANHGVYIDADGNYGFEISLPGEGGPLSCTMMANPDFTQCEALIVPGQILQHSQFGLNNAIMMAYAFASATYDTLLVHASVIRNNGYGYLFTAPSGTGKSTHTHLWYKNIPGCDLMNDDNPVVRVIDGKPIVFGSPWSGKTPCYRNIQAPIGAITRIEQAPYNKVQPMSPIEAFAMLLPAVSSMKWDRRVYNGVCQAISRLLPVTPIWRLECLPDADAAHVCYDAIHVKS